MPDAPTPLNERVVRIEERVNALPQMSATLQEIASVLAVQAERWSVTDARIRKLEEERRCGEHVEVQVRENEAAIVELKEAIAGVQEMKKMAKWVVGAALTAGLGGTALGDALLNLIG